MLFYPAALLFCEINLEIDHAFGHSKVKCSTGINIVQFSVSTISTTFAHVHNCINNYIVILFLQRYILGQRHLEVSSESEDFD